MRLRPHRSPRRPRRPRRHKLPSEASKRFARGVDPRDCDLSRSAQGPSAQAWFGYDVQGCDYYSKVIHGARVSMTIGIATVAGTTLVAVVLAVSFAVFSEATARPMGRNASGVKGVSLSKGDSLVGMVVADSDATLLTACQNGSATREGAFVRFEQTGKLRWLAPTRRIGTA